MKALRKQRLCSFLWGWGKWVPFPRRNICRPTLNSCQIHLARAVQHIPVTGKKEQPTPFLLSIHGFHPTAPAV